MMTFELPIILLNMIIIVLAYLVFYPRSTITDINKVAYYDLLVSGLALFIVGLKYWGTGQEFSLIFGNVNWFWFTLITYTLIETPVLLWNFRKVLFK
jgi:hypothetical protein